MIEVAENALLGRISLTEPGDRLTVVFMDKKPERSIVKIGPRVGTNTAASYALPMVALVAILGFSYWAYTSDEPAPTPMNSTAPK